MRGFVQVPRAELANAKLHGLSAVADSLYWRLLVGADPYGRHRAESALIQANLLYKAAASKSVTKAMLELVGSGIIVVYVHDGQQWLQIVDYDKLLSPQTIENRPEAGSPEPPPDEEMKLELNDDTQVIFTGASNRIVTIPSNLQPVINITTRSDTSDVFDYWANKESATGGIKGPKLTDARRKKIAARLAEGYTVEQLTQCIDGYLADPFYLGKNDRKTRYTGISTIFMNGERVERGIQLWKASGLANQISERFSAYDKVGQ